MNDNVYWNLGYDINLPEGVKVHHVEWDAEGQVLHIYVSTSGRKRSLTKYTRGIPLYEPDETGYDQLVGMNPVELGDPPQSLVKVMHREMAERLLGE